MNTVARVVLVSFFTVVSLVAVPDAAGASSIDAAFPHYIAVRMWVADGGFRSDDAIAITVVRGDRPKIEVGGTYLVQGEYRLESAPTALLALSLTSNGRGGRSVWAETQRRQIERGVGTFTLVAAMHDEGNFHVSFYIADRSSDPERKVAHSAGGIYFTNR